MAEYPANSHRSKELATEGRSEERKVQKVVSGKVTTKKISGVYDSDTHTIESDNEKRDILKELEDFNGVVIDFSISLKEEIDLSDN